MNQKRILIVDDDYYFRIALEKCLVQYGYEIICAENGKTAQKQLGYGNFDLMISDISMPEMGGIELLGWVKSNKKIPVILMTGISDLCETQEAIERGADAFLAKPFKKNELLTHIKKCFDSETPSIKDKGNFGKDFIENDFCRLCIEDFITGNELKFDIYLKITNDRFVKIAHCGEDLNQERILSYKRKNISHLYLKKDDFCGFLDLNFELPKLITESNRETRKENLNVLRVALESELGRLSQGKFKMEEMNHAVAIVDNVLMILGDYTDLVELLHSTLFLGDNIFIHSVRVSVFSTLIAKALGWKSISVLTKIAMGGLLHDIGKNEISSEVLLKPQGQLTEKERQILNSHPALGVDLLAQANCLPVEILQIVHQHHENCEGTGYPTKMESKRIHPYSKVVSLANDFCNSVFSEVNGRMASPVEGLQELLNENLNHYDSESLKALMRIVHGII